MANLIFLISAILCYVSMIVANPLPALDTSNGDKINSDRQNPIDKKPKSLTINIKRPEPIHESFDEKLTDDEAEVLIPKALKRRVGRFLFDILDTTGSESSGGYMSDGEDIFSGLGRLFNLNIDSNAVMTVTLFYSNIFKVEIIYILRYRCKVTKYYCYSRVYWLLKISLSMLPKMLQTL